MIEQYIAVISASILILIFIFAHKIRLDIPAVFLASISVITMLSASLSGSFIYMLWVAL